MPQSDREPAPELLTVDLAVDFDVTYRETHSMTVPVADLEAAGIDPQNPTPDQIQQLIHDSPDVMPYALDRTIDDLVEISVFPDGDIIPEP